MPLKLPMPDPELKGNLTLTNFCQLSCCMTWPLKQMRQTALPMLAEVRPGDHKVCVCVCVWTQPS